MFLARKMLARRGRRGFLEFYAASFFSTSGMPLPPRQVHLEAPGHCSERWISVVDQGCIRVDQGVSAVYQGHVLAPGLRKTLENVGEPRMPQLPAAGRTCRFIKLKERNHVFLARRMLERCAGASPWRSRILCSPFFAFGQSKGREER